MLKKGIAVVFALMLVGALVSCGGGAKYADIKDVFVKLTEAADKANAELAKATDGKGVAAAITIFANAYKEQGPKMKDLQKKYEKELAGSEPPVELKADFEKFTTSMTKFMSDTKMQEFAADADVMAAMQSMNEAMTN